jgi:hypothetical protein
VIDKWRPYITGTPTVWCVEDITAADYARVELNPDGIIEDQSPVDAVVVLGIHGVVIPLPGGAHPSSSTPTPRTYIRQFRDRWTGGAYHTELGDSKQSAVRGLSCP